MLLLHGYPHINGSIRLYSNNAILVKCGFELKEDSPSVQMEIWTDIDGSWKGYPLPYIINIRGVYQRRSETYDWCQQTGRIYGVKAFNHTYGFKAHQPNNETYEAYGYLTFPKTVKQSCIAHCTFRGRYFKSDHWSDWYWLSRSGQDAVISLCYQPLCRPTNLRHICLDCLRELAVESGVDMSTGHLRSIAKEGMYFTCIMCKRVIDGKGYSATDRLYCMI